MLIHKLKAVVRGGRILRAFTAVVEGNKPETVMAVVLPLEIAVTSELMKLRPWRDLFPFAIEAMSLIAGREGDDKRGLDLKARGQIGALHVDIYEGEVSGEPAFSFPLVESQGKPRLAIDEKGNGVIHLKVKATMTKRDLGEIGIYTDADVFVSLAESQRSIEEHTASDETSEDNDDDEELKKGKKQKREPGPYDGKEGAISYRLTADASAFLASAADVHPTLKPHEVVAAARKLARVAAGLQARRVTVSLETIREVVDQQVGAPLAPTSAAE